MTIVTRDCPGCGSSFTLETKSGGNRYYCEDCGCTRNQKHPRRPHDCAACGKSFIADMRQKYCSHDCRNERARRQSEELRKAAALATQKHCTKCDTYLPLSEFRKDRTRLDGLYPWCKSCWRSYTGTRKREPAKRLSKAEYDRNRRDRLKAQPGHHKSWRNNYLWTKYRMTPDEYDQLLSEQNGLCAICQLPQVDGRAMAVDHDHQCCPGSNSCGTCIRGLLCNLCNTAIGAFRDDTKLIEKAITYLMTYRTQQPCLDLFNTA